MSALGQKWRSGHVQSMSALPPKADIAECERRVRFVPKADIPPRTSDVRFFPNIRNRSRARQSHWCSLLCKRFRLGPIA